ncbi:membrane protein insertion efficiency factor YidD [bacterium]|nr:membrane protein insertion efficiency factor YidD [bacterium]NBX49244.1 membrane protein insertion efficiency factor YidD [bacterium]
MSLQRTTRFLVTLPIRLYQKTLSYDHGPLKVFYPHGYCPFYPTCSMYGRQAIEKYGVIKGMRMTAHRILRCHPWTKGGIDKP